MARFPFPAARLSSGVFVLSLASSLAHPQTPIQSTIPKPSGLNALPPGPPVGDWQPRSRAVAGGTIVITGQNFRPADFQASIGPAHVRLPVRLATSTASRIELDVPESALGQQGTLAVGYATTSGTVLDTAYRIDVPKPAVIDASVGGPVTPFVKRNLVVHVREFTAPKANGDGITFGGTCGFQKHAGVTIGTISRASDLSLSIAVQGWFERSGSCQLQLNVPALTASGGSAGTVTVATPFAVDAPQRYVFDNTSQLATRLGTQLVVFGLGNVCQSSTNGVLPGGADLQIISQGGAFDVQCVFQTKAWVLPAGVRLAEMTWRGVTVGNRCGLYGTFTHTFPGVNFTFSKGVAVVRPAANQPVTDFFAFGDNTVVTSDGVRLASNLDGPRTVVMPMSLGIQCVSMAVILQTSAGSFGPTTDPQSFAFVLDRVVLEGPPGLTIADLLK